MFDKKYIESRVMRSKQTMQEAMVMFEKQYYLTVINRLYYSVFYIAGAFLGTEEIRAKSHSGLKAKFHEVFILTGRVEKRFGQLYDRLFSERNESDYGDFDNPSKEYIETLLNETEEQLQIVWQKFEEEN